MNFSPSIADLNLSKSSLSLLKLFLPLNAIALILYPMDFIYFATTNKDKLGEAAQILGVKVEGVKLDVPEIQSLDMSKVALYKARHYYRELKHPLFVEDTSLIFSALNGLPGPYIRDMSEALGNEGLVKLLSGFSDRTAKAVMVKTISLLAAGCAAPGTMDGVSVMVSNSAREGAPSASPA